MDEFIISKHKKMYVDKGKLFIFDVPAFIQAISEEKNYSTSKLAIKLEEVADDEFCKGRTASRVQRFLKGKEEILGISTIRLLGLAFREDEMAFLEEVEFDTVTQALEEHEGKNNVNAIKGVYKMLYEILSEVMDSHHYNFIPETETDGFLYYERKIDAVKAAVNVTFLDRKEIREKLLQIADETEIFMKSYSVPGVVKRWGNINRQITFFDAVYDFYEDNRELYDKICDKKFSMWNGMKISFSFIPTERDIEERTAYFSRVAKMIADNNLQYSSEKVFKNELLNTLQLVFEHDFPELKI